MSVTVFSHPKDLLEAKGTLLGPTEYITIDQQRINQFAEATGDHQWIHVDEERAAKSDFGATIAHGYLTLSLASFFLPQMMKVDNVTMGINYGTNSVRFPAAGCVNSKLRGRGEIVEVDEARGGIRSVVRITIELEGSDRPACVLDTISLSYS